mgnify:CR=1 FL=1
MSKAPPAPVQAVRGLAVLAESPGDEHAAIACALGLESVPSLAEYSDLFLFQLYPYASVYLGTEGMIGGTARDRHRRLWHAVGLRPPREPDHLASLLGLYASLIERAERGESEAEALLSFQAAWTLLMEHLCPWVFAWLDRMQELSSGFYASWASLLQRCLMEELSGERSIRFADDAVDSEIASLQHLRDVPSLPDPRRHGSESFVTGLLASISSGMIITRADLGRIARSLDLGLRAGERRYALEHLIAQDAEGTLRALVSEAHRQGDIHKHRIKWLGESSEHLSRRCYSTAALLDELVQEDLK